MRAALAPPPSLLVTPGDGARGILGRQRRVAQRRRARRPPPIVEVEQRRRAVQQPVLRARARPIRSSGASRAIATARSTSCVQRVARQVGGRDAAPIARPTKTRRPSSALSDRPTSSSAPSRTETSSDGVGGEDGIGGIGAGLARAVDDIGGAHARIGRSMMRSGVQRAERQCLEVAAVKSPPLLPARAQERPCVLAWADASAGRRAYPHPHHHDAANTSSPANRFERNRAQRIRAVGGRQRRDLPREMRRRRQQREQRQRIGPQQPDRRRPQRQRARRRRAPTPAAPVPPHRAARTSARRSAHRPRGPAARRSCRSRSPTRSTRHRAAAPARASAPATSLQPTSAAQENTSPSHACGHQVIRFMNG